MMEIVKCLALSIGISLLAAWGFALLRSKVKHGLEESEQSLIGGAASFAATFFAFLLGFVIVGLWGSYNSADKLVREEVNSLRTLYRLGATMPSSQKMQDLVHDYALSVASDEWPLMTQGKFSSKSDELKNNLWTEALKVIADKQTNPVFGKEALDSLVAMNQARRERLSMLNSSLHPLLLLGLGVTGLAMLAGRFFLATKQRYVQFLVDFLVLLCVTVALYLVLAVDQPFSGTGFTVSNESFGGLARQIAAERGGTPTVKVANPNCPTP